MKTLTKRQKLVFDFVSGYISKHGISPTLEEVRKNLKLKAISTVHEHINFLIEKGYLSKSDNSVRGLVIEKEKQEFLKIPIVGRLVTGIPTKKDRNDPRAYFAVKITDNSMSKQGFFSGDIVIIKFKE